MVKLLHMVKGSVSDMSFLGIAVDIFGLHLLQDCTIVEQTGMSLPLHLFFTVCITEIFYTNV